jgi:hypothetical protein
MIYTAMTKLALSISFDAHKDQVDKGGTPYVYHPFYLASQMDNEDAVCVALLHDVVEDHGDRYGFEVLKEKGFNARILEALHLLTHDPKVPYLAYVRAIAENPFARAVKRADLHHNLTGSRRPDPRPLEKTPLYVKSLSCLERYPAYDKPTPVYLSSFDHQRFFRLNEERTLDELLDGAWQKTSLKEKDLSQEKTPFFDLTYYDDQDPNRLTNAIVWIPYLWAKEKAKR